MLVQFGNNWIQKIPLTAKLDSACGLVQFWLSSEFFSSNYFQIGQHVVLLHILILNLSNLVGSNSQRKTLKLKVKINVNLPQLLSIVVSVALNGAFERFGG